MSRFLTNPSRWTPLARMGAAPELATIEKRGNIAILRLNDPKKLNPMTHALGAALRGENRPGSFVIDGVVFDGRAFIGRPRGRDQ